MELESAVEESQLAEAIFHGVEIEFQVAEDFGIWQELNLCAVALGGPDVLDLGDRDAFFVTLLVSSTIATDSGDSPFGKRGHSLGTHAVQTGGGFVGAFVEFGSCPDGGHNHLEGRLTRLGMHINRDAAAVIEDEDGIVDIDLNDDDLAVASEVFVNGVVDQFVDQVV